MKIGVQHIDEPGLVVLDITAADEETAHAWAPVQRAVAGCRRGGRDRGPQRAGAVQPGATRIARVAPGSVCL
ncbi:DUF6207 family protein [Streptomyces atratus]|uniref:DUF6207 family protein n=1 Tax=Streptomyces atratus TaxID=1893 RepID=UPI00386F1675